MTLKYESNVDDIIAYRSYVYDTSKKIQSKIKKYQMIYLLFSIIAAVFFYLDNSPLNLFLLTFSSIFFIKTLFFNKILYLKRIRKTLLMHKPDFGDSIIDEIILFEDFFIIKDREVESKLFIRNIEKVIRTNNY